MFRHKLPAKRTVRHDHRETAGERFEHREAEALALGRDDDRIGSVDPKRNLLRVYRAERQQLGAAAGGNRLGAVDTFRRYIYLHGTPDTEPMGTPLSHGCIRLRNADMLALFECVPLHCKVRIDEAPCPQWAADLDFT